ncbi:unnamed protein product [Penicillium bialowiezense]
MSSSEESLRSPFNPTPAVTPSGIIHDHSSGKSYVPASTRPDGTERKEITIRPGYQPKEDMVVYKTPALRMAAPVSPEQEGACSSPETTMNAEMDTPRTPTTNPSAADLPNDRNPYTPATAREQELFGNCRTYEFADPKYTEERVLAMLEAQAKYQPPGRLWEPAQQKLHDILTNFKKAPNTTREELPQRDNQTPPRRSETNDRSQEFSMQDVEQVLSDIASYLNRPSGSPDLPARNYDGGYHGAGFL